MSSLPFANLRIFIYHIYYFKKRSLCEASLCA